MVILRDLLQPLQANFPETGLGRERAFLFVDILLSVIMPFRLSITSNVLRCLETLFGIDVQKKQFYPCVCLQWTSDIGASWLNIGKTSSLVEKSFIDISIMVTKSGLKGLKQEIISCKSQCRKAQSVTNHLNFWMMATTITRIYADRQKAEPE